MAVLDDGDEAAMRQVHQDRAIGVADGDGLGGQAFQHDPRSAHDLGRLAAGPRVRGR